MEKILKEFVNIEKNIRKNNTAILAIAGVMMVMVIAFSVVIYKLNVFYASHRLVLESEGTVRRARVISEKEALIVEIKDFMCSFYSTFYSFNQYNIDSCLNLAFYKGDESLRNLYAKYKNEGWYNTILQENIYQTSTIDLNGFDIDVSSYPYNVSVRGIMILRKGDEVKRFSISGSCHLEQIARNFPKNPHGLFIRGWKEEKHEL